MQKAILDISILIKIHNNLITKVFTFQLGDNILFIYLYNTLTWKPNRLKSFSVVTFVLSALLISWNRDTPTIDKIPYDNEIESHLIKKEGVLVGSSGNYKFAINQNLSILKIYFDGNQYVVYSKTPPDSKNLFELTN